jgi:hypothetical protein
MHLTAELEELTEGQLLDHAEAVALQQRRCEVQQLRIAVQHALIHNAERLDPEHSRLPGRERARLFGGVGTPLVTSFAPAALGARIGISSAAASYLIADALDIALRLPRLWARVEALEVKAPYARHVARRTRDLGPEQADLVDEAVVEVADGRVPWTRFEEIVEGAIVASDPEAAAERERALAERMFARPSRSTVDGIRGFHILAPFPIVTLLDARVAWFASVLEALGDERSVDERRVAAVALLADPPAALELMRRFQQWRERPADPAPPLDEPSDDRMGSPMPCPPFDRTRLDGDRPEVDWSAVLPAVRLYLHFYPGQSTRRGPAAPAGSDPPPEQVERPPRSQLEDDVGAVVRTEHDGPVTVEWVREFLGGQARFTVTPVLDLAGQAPVDAYEVPPRHREAVQLMSPADVFPWGTSTSRAREIDHTVPFVHGSAAVGEGQSRVGNYGPMSRYHHLLKTHGGWQVEQPFAGIYVWRDPHGRLYLVDHTGTRALPPAQPAEMSRVEWSFHRHAIDYDLTV